jgi:hypothetical protein
MHTLRSMNELFLQTISCEGLYQRMQQEGMDPVQAGVAVLQSRIQKLRALVQQGRVDIDVCVCISLKNMLATAVS